MKKLVVLLVIVISISSCTMDGDMFSCDPDANLWAKSNIAEIQLMTRADFLAIGDVVYQRAAFKAFTPNQRQSVWIEKLENVLKLDWTEQENQFIESMLEFVKTNSFIYSNKRDPKSFEKVEIELYRWTVYAYEELNWDKKLLYGIVGTPQEMNENKEIRSNLLYSKTIKTGSEECECRDQDFSDFCSNQNVNGRMWSCQSGGCDFSSWGCGWIWVQDCDGLCVEK